ncbi:MAG TPA: pyridoxal-phosphate dependent enzyme, partial [Deltaproteobacteria bacterium]|nr:pyridoxal-phosphate dependent enzyme [Deltaproteobacteria bacterium]
KWRLTGNYQPIKVKPSVAQAAMIGDPVSFPKVAELVQEYFSDRFYAIALSEDEIMEGMLMANRHGHVVCTQGGESIAGLKKAIEQKIIEPSGRFVVDSTSHQLKFASFQQMYFENRFDPGYEISPKDSFKNSPIRMEANASIIADFLGLQRK